LDRADSSNERPFDVRYAAVLRASIELSSPIGAQSVLAGGQSGHPFSAHYSDQLSAWLQGHQLPIATQWQDVAGSAIQLQPSSP
jgi:penicillin G amidase